MREGLPIDLGGIEPDLSDETQESSEELEQDKQSKALRGLQKRGLIEITEEGQVICDPEELGKHTNQSRNLYRKIYGYVGFPAVQDTFRGVEVISRQDWDNGTREGKALVYEPTSDDTALDPSAIKAADFYLSPNRHSRKFYFPQLQEINPEEAAMALYIYHPRYGNGSRDLKTGNLMVRWPDGKIRKFNSHFFHDYGFDPGYRDQEGQSYGFNSRPSQFLQSRGKHLSAVGILKPEDFRALPPKLSGETQISKPVENGGFVFFDGVHYYVGKNFRGAETTVISPRVALVSQDNQVTHFFGLRPDLKSGTLKALTAQETNLQNFDPEAFEEKFENESEEDYQERISGYKRFEENQLTELAFKKYPEIVQASERVKEFLDENFSESTENSPEVIKQIIHHLQTRATEVLTKGERYRSPAEIISQLAELKADLLVFASTLKTLKESGQAVDLNDFRQANFDTITATDLNSDDQNQLRAILKDNWGKPEYAKIYPVLSRSMEESFQDPSVRYRIFKYPVDNEPMIVTFQRFQDLAPGVTYAAGNNVRPQLRGMRIGEAAQSAILGQELQDHVVLADAYLKAQVISHYINKSGFVGTGFYSDFHHTGEPYLAMVNDITAARKYQGFDLAPEGAISAFNLGQFPEGMEIVKIDVSQVDLQPYFEGGRVISKWVWDPAEKGTAYLVFEANQSNYRAAVENNELKLQTQELAEPQT